MSDNNDNNENNKHDEKKDESSILNSLLSTLSPLGKKLSRQQRVAAAHMVLTSNVILCGPRQCGKRWVANAFMRVMNNAQRSCINVSLTGTELKHGQVIMKEPYGPTLEQHATTAQTWIVCASSIVTPQDLQTWMTCFDFYLKLRRNSVELFGGCQVVVIYDTPLALNQSDFPSFMLVQF